MDKIKKLINFFGLDLYKFSPSNNNSLQLYRSLLFNKIDVVFDIGANSGQFASNLISMGYKGKIISFEPLRDAHQQLIKKAIHNPNWIVHERCAIGDINGEISLNVSNNSVSSSLLNMLPKHIESAAESYYIEKENVKIFRFDDVFSIYTNIDSRFVIKIDTQGYEWEVLKGSPIAIEKSSGIICELSLVPLYENQHLWMEIIEKLSVNKLKLFSIQRGFTDNINGQTLQIDGIFFK